VVDFSRLCNGARFMSNALEQRASSRLRARDVRIVPLSTAPVTAPHPRDALLTGVREYPPNQLGACIQQRVR
jgi:hypothetical protein